MDLRDLAQDAEKMSSDAASTPESSVNEEVACGVTVEMLPGRRKNIPKKQ